MLARGEFLVVDEGEHRLARNAEHRDDEAALDVVAVVGIGVVDDVAARFPERFSGVDHARRLAFGLERISPSSV
jgi:hypothetical protein